MAQALRRPAAYGSIALVAVLLLFVSVSAGIFVVSTYASHDDARSFTQRMYLETEKTFRAAIDPRFQSKADEVSRVTTRLVVIDVIKGGALFDDSGHLQQTFGEPTDTSFETIQRTGLRVFPAHDERRVEFYFPPSVTETPFHLLARVDTGTMSLLEGLALERRLLVSGAGGLVAALAGALVVFLLVALPVRRMIRVIERVISDPATADHGDQLATGRSEIGVLAIYMERLRSSVAEIWRTKVMVADAILENAPFAVIQIASDGSPIYANPASSAVFQRDVVRTQNTMPAVVRDVATGARLPIRDHLAAHNADPRLVEIAHGEGSNFALIGGFTVGQQTRTPTTIVMIADVSALHRARQRADADLAAERARLRLMNCRELELKLMLESCLTLLSGPERGQDTQVDALKPAAEWLDLAEKTGLITAKNLTPEAPLVAGAVDEIRAAVRLALLVATARIGTFPAVAAVDVRGINFETVGVTVKAAAAAGADGHPTSADWQLAFAALRMALRKVGGQLGEFDAGPDGTTVKFVLRGASERLQTGFRAGSKG